MDTGPPCSVCALAQAIGLNHFEDLVHDRRIGDVSEVVVARAGPAVAEVAQDPAQQLAGAGARQARHEPHPAGGGDGADGQAELLDEGGDAMDIRLRHSDSMREFRSASMVRSRSSFGSGSAKSGSSLGADGSAEDEEEAEDPAEAFVGLWQNVRTDNLEEYLKRYLV